MYTDCYQRWKLGKKTLPTEGPEVVVIYTEAHENCTFPLNIDFFLTQDPQES